MTVISKPKFQCPYCRFEGQPIDVHGHLQCQKCKMVLEGCCGGAELGIKEDKKTKKNKT